MFGFFKAKHRAIALNTNEGIAVTGEVHGDVYQIAGNSYPVEKLQRPWKKARAENIASMLRWNSRIPHKLYGREETMDEMRKWALKSDPLLVRLIHGAGGAGKTRFAFELAESLTREHRWEAGHVVDPGSKLAYRTGKQGTLLILDYPEERLDSVRGLMRRLKDMPDPEQPLRILLLSRRDMAAELAGEDLRDKLDASVELLPLSDNDDNAWALFQAAWQQMAALKDPRGTLPLDETQFQHWLAQHPQHRLPLFIVAYGRHLLDQPQAIQLSGMEIIRELSDREISRLRKSEHGVKIAENGLLMLKAIACLHGGLSETDVRLLATHSTEALTLPNCKTLAKTPEWQEKKWSAGARARPAGRAVFPQCPEQ